MNCIRSSTSTDSSTQMTRVRSGPSAKSSNSRLRRPSRPMSAVSTAPSSNVPSHGHQDAQKVAFEGCVEFCKTDSYGLAVAEEELGSVDASDGLPTKRQLDSARDIPLYDLDGHSRPFKSLYQGEEHMGHRQLIVFVRHFYCGACQAYLKALTATFTPYAYFSLPIPTQITVIGCGAPDLIPRYTTRTNCPFRIYAEPTRKLYKALGMGVAVKPGTRNEYTSYASASSIVFNSLAQMGQSPRNEMFRGGHMAQMGGEFLFEESRPIWCHRMRNSRGHSDMAILKRVLEMEDASGHDTDAEELREQERRRAPSQVQLFEQQQQQQQEEEEKQPQERLKRTKSWRRAKSNSSERAQHDEDPTLTALPLSARVSVSLPRRDRSNTASSRHSLSQGLQTHSPSSSAGLKVIWDGRGQGHIGRESRMGVV